MKQQMKVFVFMRKRQKYDYTAYPYTCTEVWEPLVYPHEMSDDETRIYLNEQTIEVETPDDFDPAPKQVAALEAEKRKAMDEYQAKVASINERLSKLQAIEFAP